jgi:hypothetical protein
MNKLLIPTPSRGIDFGWEILEFLLGTTTLKGGIHDTIQNMMRTYGDNFIVYGCAVAGSAVSAGLVMLDGELLTVDAHAKSGDYFVKVTTDETTWTIQDLDGNTQNILKKNRATLSGASGNLKYDGNDLGDLIITKAGYGIKRVSIGTWDMNANATKTVAHGLTVAQADKIINIQAIFHHDTLPTNYPINCFNTSAQLSDGGITYWDATNVYLERRTGGVFDDANFDSTANSRGYINIFYLL